MTIKHEIGGTAVVEYGQALAVADAAGRAAVAEWHAEQAAPFYDYLNTVTAAPTPEA